MKLPNATHVLTTFRSLTAVFALALGLGLAVSARAATWTVTSTNDLRYIDAGSLGYILQYLANSGDTINFATNLSGQSIVLSSFGQLTLSGKNLTIDASALPGGVTIVTAYPNYRILEVDSGIVVLNKLTLTGGTTTGTGGGIYVLGGTLTLNQCTLSGNSAGNGGAIYNNSTLTLNQCTLSANSASSIGGGGVCNSGTLTLSQCTLSGNSAGTAWGAVFTTHPAAIS